MSGAVGVTELSSARELSGDKAARIVDAMRASVAERGIAGATFDHVARVAGVSRGLLHYYFGSKERLLVEAARRETEVRHASLEEALAGADTVEHVMDLLVRGLEDFLDENSGPALMFHELLSLAGRNQEIADELAELGRQTRSHLAGALSAKADAGVLTLRDEPEAVAAFLVVLADGITVRRLSEPEFDIRPLMDKAVAAARPLLS
ncbi:MAG TPA: TetR/AcrR family transcriptional regulator [Solirubrobacteraceae bacterium]|nr:TetR/AcrR family transcriptional regulator [Solirubrobacteraceae bacterium]